MGRRAPGALFEEARVSLEEEDVVEEVEREGPEVEERRNETPILSPCQSGCAYAQNMGDAYLASKEYGAYAVEQLERRDDVALHQHRGAESCRHPPACTHGHLVEPLLERESTHHATVPALQRLCHGCGIDKLVASRR